MAIFAQACQNGGDGTATSIVSNAFASNTITGNTIVVAVVFTPGVTVTSVTDSGSAGNVYTRIGTAFTGTSGFSCDLFFSPMITGGTTPTVTANLSATTGFRRIVAFELTGNFTLDKTMGDAGGTGTVLTGNSVTTTANGEFIFGACGSGTSGTASAGTGFTLPANATASVTDSPLFVVYQEQVSAGSIAALGATSVSAGWDVYGATFKPTGGMSTGIPVTGMASAEW